VNENGKIWSDGLAAKAVWHVVREHAGKAGIESLRHTIFAGADSVSSRQVSVQTTERYLGSLLLIRLFQLVPTGCGQV